jgi:hypothetical protein
MTNPVWEWLFRGRIDPYIANERFKSAAAKLRGDAEFPSEPRWAGCRLGQSHTKLADGREIWIAGEHEDFYDPDFFIYNDVIVEHPGGRLQILGYPATVIPPTDFHSATAIDGDAAILIIGSIGYPEDRRPDHTPVYRLDTRTFEIAAVATTGNPPGWIHRHTAELSADGQSIVLRGGELFTADEELVENIDELQLRLSDLRWVQLTDRRWPQLSISREDDEMLHLWQYNSLEFKQNHPEFGGDETELAEELGAPPNLEAYQSLYTPSLPHQLIEKDWESEDDWRTTTLMIDAVKVRVVDDMNSLKLTVEGQLPESQIEAFAEELRQKLSLVENAPCTVKRIR